MPHLSGKDRRKVYSVGDWATRFRRRNVRSPLLQQCDGVRSIFCRKLESGNQKKKYDHSAVGAEFVVAAGWRSCTHARARHAQCPRSAWNSGVSGIVHRQGTGIVHARRGAPAFICLRGIGGGVPECRRKGFPLRDGALGPGDDGIPPTVGAIRRTGGIVARLGGDSEGAGTAAEHAARKRLYRGAGRFF